METLGCFRKVIGMYRVHGYYPDSGESNGKADRKYMATGCV